MPHQLFKNYELNSFFLIRILSVGLEVMLQMKQPSFIAFKYKGRVSWNQWWEEEEENVLAKISETHLTRTHLLYSRFTNFAPFFWNHHRARTEKAVIPFFIFRTWEFLKDLAALRCGGNDDFRGTMLFELGVHKFCKWSPILLTYYYSKNLPNKPITPMYVYWYYPKSGFQRHIIPSLPLYYSWCYPLLLFRTAEKWSSLTKLLVARVKRIIYTYTLDSLLYS